MPRQERGFYFNVKCLKQLPLINDHRNSDDTGSASGAY